MKFVLAPLIIVLDIVLLYALWNALPWLWSAFLVLAGVAIAGWVVYIAVRLALRAGRNQAL